MANNQNIVSAKNLNLHYHLADHIPRRRKRHFNKMSLVLWIFIGCCLTLFINPLHAQAKELNNATSKDENMLPNDHQLQQQLKGDEAKMMLLDKTNDNGTFKRLQTVENTELEEEEEGEEEDEHSSEVIEMIQPPHTLRHQEHYKQRILQAGKHENAQKNSHDDKDDEIEEQQERVSSLYNRNLRYKQIQFALREPIASPAPHHKRHEHHLAKQQQQQRMENTWPQQHHLRHQHHQQQQQQQNLEFHRHYTQPQLRHLNHEMRKQNASTTTRMKTQTHQRYFDRESSYVNPLTRIATTEGPTHLRHTGSNKHWKSITYSSNPHNRLFNDDGNNSHKEEEGEEDIKRFSLSLDGHENEQEMENANKGKESLDDYTIANDDAEEGNANYHINSKDKDNIDNENDDDYSYDDEEDVKEINKQNSFPSITTNTKTNVKRYTNPLRSLYTPASPSKSYLNRSPTFNHHHLRHSSSNKDIMKTNTNANNNDDDDNDDYDDIENNEDDLAISSSYESSDDEDDKMSDEKWNKIEHEHYRKQMQHQRAMQALRLRRPQNDNNPQTTITTTAKSNKYSLYSPSSLSAPSTLNTAWTKRQTINDDGEGENIYSRSYVPGSVTRKKEEELGTPAAVLESRRQYALQQRQNKALASAHHRRIVTEGICRLPQPRVERIRRDSWKIYTPHCTILHRCADDAGCCPSERQTCAPKRTKNVDLYFFVISLNETQGSVEKLTFVNHTECHCVDRSKQRAPEYATSGARDLMTLNNQIPFLRRATILNCYCPNLFEKILQEDGYCRCDCSSGNMGCDWLKRGMEHFSMNDRKCIIEGRCKLPTCEYGQYVKKHGRCPRREERHLSADLDW